MSLVAVDLAARYSAAVWMGDYRVLQQWDSWQKPEGDFITLVTGLFLGLHGPIPDVLMIEDLPARVPWMTTVKDACRLQGRIVERMSNLGALDRVMFVQPATWQEHYGLKRGSGPGAVVPLAARFHYQPPPLGHRCAISIRTRKPLASEVKTAAKVATDYCAAYLIGRWATDYHCEHDTYDAPRTSRYPKA